MANQPDYFPIGFINKAHGVKGELQMLIQHADFERIASFNFVFFLLHQKYVPFAVEKFRPTLKDNALLKLEDVNTIDTAHDFLKKEVFLPKRFLPRVSKKEFSWLDVVDFEVEEVNLGALGIITEVKEMPQQFMAFLNYQEKEIMFPLHSDFVKKLSVKEKKILVQLPYGLIDVYLEA